MMSRGVGAIGLGDARLNAGTTLTVNAQLTAVGPISLLAVTEVVRTRAL